MGFIVSKDGKILFGKKDPKKGGVYADCWHLPGGGIEVGESETAALAREMREEVGIDIANASVTLLDDKGTGTSNRTLKETGETVLCEMTFKVYRIELDKNANDIAARVGDDIAETIWLEPKQLKDYNLTPPSVELFTRLAYI